MAETPTRSREKTKGIPFRGENGALIYLDPDKAEGKALKRIREEQILAEEENPLDNNPLYLIDDENIAILSEDNQARKLINVEDVTAADWQETIELIDYFLACIKALRKSSKEMETQVI
jgi:hypothetical protein